MHASTLTTADSILSCGLRFQESGLGPSHTTVAGSLVEVQYRVPCSPGWFYRTNATDPEKVVWGGTGILLVFSLVSLSASGEATFVCVRLSKCVCVNVCVCVCVSVSVWWWMQM